MAPTGLLVAALGLGGIGSVLAADMPIKAPVYKAPAPRPVIVNDVWSGIYFGGHIGGGWSHSDVGDPLGGLAPIGTFVGANGSGVLGGPQLGVNWQFGSFVFGVQGDISFMHINTSTTSPLFPTTFINTTTNWASTATGRVGYAMGPMLFYAKGGAAWVRDHYSVIDPTFGIDATTRVTRSGWVAGGGFEYAFLPNWSVFVEYDYIGIGTNNNITLSDPTFGPSPLAAKQNLQMAKGGVNYKFWSWR